MATSFECKYTETSAALNHNVDELLVGILTQIRLKQAERGRFGGGRRAAHGSRGGGGGGSRGLKAAAAAAVSRRKSAGVKVRGILDKMLGSGDSKSKSCDDLHVL